MGIFGALNTAVAGLRAQAFALENVSGNIANSQTTAFKRIDTSFLDLIPQSGVNNQLAGSVNTSSRETNTVQGDVSNVSVSTFMAISGSGFFTVQKPSSFVDANPVFDGLEKYTRRGDFQLDKNGFLVNGAGYYIEGIPIDPVTGNLVGSVPQVLKFANDFLPAQETSAISYRANLPSVPFTKERDKAVPGSELLNPADFLTSPASTTVAAVAPIAGTFTTAANISDLGGAPPLPPVGGATKVAGAAGTDSLVTDFVVGDILSIAINGGAPVNITFTGAATSLVAPFNINVPGGSVSNLLAAINAITGGTSSISGTGAITLNGSTASDATITFTPSTPANAWADLGFAPTTNLNFTPGIPAGTGTVTGAEAQKFIDQSISGGAVTAFDVSGSSVSLQFRWAKVDSATLGAGPPPHSDVWNLFFQVSTDPAAPIAWQNVNTDFRFAANGQQVPPGVAAVTLTAPVINGVALSDITINLGSGGLTQFADANGTVHVNQISQNGFPAGELETVQIGENGRVIGNFSNGRNVDLAQISISTFNGANFLKRIDGGAFEVTDQSGPALLGGGGTVAGASLESSNVDIADEFTKLIVTQQAYSANTRVITTANSMVQDLLNVVR